MGAETNVSIDGLGGLLTRAQRLLYCDSGFSTGEMQLAQPGFGVISETNWTDSVSTAGAIVSLVD